MRFHSERLHSQQERILMRDHWRNVLDRLESALTGNRIATGPLE